ncbi:DUF6483 family protein [Cohnella nanjingensis]|uniref:Tetratricopeptide repeat protein n=1 Tax=Cohnella nanjingensis TaxID=1387779 RepID=A0A7X0RRX4_9BACL|nr:DUF6483 family protein [Cohnella nanjingensis]MBB6672569.1 hypothetical protein [Cohnella nanjingensis]
MHDRDYLMRLISQMSVAFGRLMGLKEQKKHEEAIVHIDEFLSRELRLRARLALGLSDKDLLAMFSTGGVPNAETVAIIATFLQEEGDLLRELGRDAESVPRYEKALRLMLYVLRVNGPIEGLGLEIRKNMLLTALADESCSAETRRAIWVWQEYEGRYAEAEDLLYDLSEDGAVTPEDGREFYDRLDRLGDEALASGGLTRDELQDGRRQWQSLTGETAS